ncbi:hypothetical protein Enr10x_47160 [Gimesia panareensis]|uniref:Uncharacterized protein n=1 Tax=Gimesia panareensis TaxID=2527978 RepID=A0A517QCL1_9PLAN|nr:hypothetical protein Enr10x_47160 [Gimesia panareensis]QDU52405.1 hypothetical protein Pan110_47820 [Gimesia panareensis]
MRLPNRRSSSVGKLTRFQQPHLMAGVEELCSIQPGVLKRGVTQYASDKPGSAQVGLGKIRALQLRIPEVSAPQRRPLE